MFATPILFIVFNRPEETRLVFERIKQIQPKYLYIAADGPRADRPNDKLLCAQTRKLVLDAIDWECEVRTMFRDENLGCGKAVSEGITWFFEHVEQGIILEDDCLPDLSFFSFCEEMLLYYSDNETIMHVGGNNSQFGKKRNVHSYYFSKYPHIWGWATWKRAWQKFHYEFSINTTKDIMQAMNYYSFDQKEIEYWSYHWEILNSENKIDTWDIQWTFSCWLNKGISIVPNVNMISNIGFSDEATHTNQLATILANTPTQEIKTITHPKQIIIDNSADLFTFKKYNLLEPFLLQRMRNWVSNKTPNFIKLTLKKRI